MVWFTMAELLYIRGYYTKTSLHRDPQGLCYRITSKWNHFIKTSSDASGFHRAVWEDTLLEIRKWFVEETQILKTNEHCLEQKSKR